MISLRVRIERLSAYNKLLTSFYNYKSVYLQFLRLITVPTSSSVTRKIRDNSFSRYVLLETMRKMSTTKYTYATGSLDYRVGTSKLLRIPRCL